MDVVALGQRAAVIAGLPAEWIVAQWRHETGDFTSELVADNNFGGLKDKFGNYMTFPTPEAFADYFGGYLTLYRPDGIYNSSTVDEYVRSLRNGGYFTDSYENYVNGVKRFLNQSVSQDYTTPNTVTVKDGTWLEKLKSRINSPLSFEKTIPDSIKQQEGLLNQAKESLTKGLKATGMVVVGIALLVLGIFLLSKDNTVIMKTEKEGD